MKKIVCILLLVIGFNQLLSAQANKDTARPKPSNRELSLQYLKKANTQRTVALILLGTGVAGIFAGIAIQDFTGIGLFLAGTAFCIASIPIFIAGSINRKRYNLIIKKESIHAYNNYGFGKTGLVSLGLSIPLGGSRK